MVLGILFFQENHLILATISLFMVSIFSTTVFLLVTVVQFWFFLVSFNFFTVMILVPSFLWVFLSILFIFSTENNVVETAKKIKATFSAIGTTRSEAKYQRKREAVFRLNKTQIYFSCLFLLFYIGMIIITGEFFMVSIAAYFAYLFNAKIARFSDKQTIEFFLFIACLIDITCFSVGWYGLLLLIPWSFFPFIFNIM